MRLPLVGARNNSIYVEGLNVGTSVIAPGTPVFLGALFAAASTAEGVDATGICTALDAAALSAANANCAELVARNYSMIGIASSNINANARGDIFCYGVTTVNLLVASRAASTAAWAAYTGIPASTGIALGAETVQGKYFVTLQNASVVTNYQIVALDTVANGASSASATSDTRSLITASIRAFVRLL